MSEPSPVTGVPTIVQSPDGHVTMDENGCDQTFLCAIEVARQFVIERNLLVDLYEYTINRPRPPEFHHLLHRVHKAIGRAP